ncbi:MAG: hypothetical protein IK016_07500, partial [Lachnospiraceae bacterium]|nr:hypothetical protein [Lachnospiraceae bacterium]
MKQDPDAPGGRKEKRSKQRKIMRRMAAAFLVALAVLCVAFSVRVPVFASGSTPPPPPPPDPSVSGAPAISGTPQFGYTVEADLSGITYADPEKPFKKDKTYKDDVVEHRWLLDGREIGTEDSYKIQKTDVGKTLRLELIYKGNRPDTSKLKTYVEVTIGKTVLPAPADFEIEYKPKADDEGNITYDLMIPGAKGCEYSFDGYNWSEDVRGLKGVAPGTNITAYRRFMATEFSEASEAAVAHLSLPVIPAETEFLEMPGAGDAAYQKAVRDALTAEQKAKANEESGRNDPAQANDIYSKRAAGDAEAGGAQAYYESSKEDGTAAGGSTGTGGAGGTGGA